MNAIRWFLLLLLNPAWLASAAESQADLHASTPPRTTAASSATAPRWRDVIQESDGSPAWRIGRSDFVVSGPLLEGLRRRQSPPNRSLGQKLLSFPLIRLFVPQPMPSAPGGGKYFLWGESRRPWTTVAAGASARCVDAAIMHRPEGALLSLGR